MKKTNKTKQYIIPIFVPHLGCPNDCIFCNQKAISGRLKKVTKDDVRKTVDYYLASFKEEEAEREIAFFGGSFTGIEEELQEELLQTAYDYIQRGKIDSIRISTRPDYINKEILKRLKKYKVKTIELGVQSTNDYILNRSGRGHTFLDVKKASKLIRFYGFKLGHQMMVGLPESTRLDELNTAKDLIKLKPKMVRIYPVLVIKNTKLEQEYNNGEFEPITLNQAVERCKELVYLFNKSKAEVIRIGLQNTEVISEPNNGQSDVVAGPFHPAFGQLVEDSIWYDSIVDKIKKVNVKVKEVEVRVHPQDINSVIGHKRENAKKLKELYEVDIKVAQDPSMKIGKSEIKILKTFNDFKEEDKVTK
ncbi:MAG: radical SAM protein [Clostridia bacterium]|nr:radical SAM protein [Clostridia bacterium]